MRLTVKVALVIAFVALDIVLVALAVRHVRQPASTDSGPSTPTLTSDDDSTTPPATTPTQPTTSNTEPPPPKRSDTLLSIGVDGVLLRATTGDCQAGESGSVEVSTDGGQTFETALSEVAQVVRVVAVSRSDLWIVETGETCAAAVQRSGDLGESWVRSPGSRGAWHLSPIGGDGRVHAPGGPRRLGCVGISLAPLDVTLAYAACDNGDVRVSTDAGTTWSTTGHVDGLVALSFEDASTGLALATDEGCAARVLTTNDNGQTWRRSSCMEGEEPEAIATNGSQVVAQVDDQLIVSDDGGQTWSLPT